MQQAQALHHLFAIFGGEGLEELVPLIVEEHEGLGCSKAGDYSKAAPPIEFRVRTDARENSRESG
jgi:hypothetical protein